MKIILFSYEGANTATITDFWEIDENKFPIKCAIASLKDDFGEDVKIRVFELGKDITEKYL